jgi:hypothetical protein
MLLAADGITCVDQIVLVLWKGHSWYADDIYQSLIFFEAWFLAV